MMLETERLILRPWREDDAAMQGWQTVPVVIPTYNFGKCKVGLDIGGLLLDVLQHIVYDK